MSISQACVAPRNVFPRTKYVFASLLFLLISTSTSLAATLVVPNGGDLQAAINSAVPGDTIVLDAGATYRGPFTLPKKTGDSYITIQSSRATEITGRVSPSQSNLLARLRSSISDPIIRLSSALHHTNLSDFKIPPSTPTNSINIPFRLASST